MVVRAAGQVTLRAGAAHAGGEPTRALVVGSGAREVAGDGRRVVGRGQRLSEVDGRGGDRRRLGAGREERAEVRRGGAPPRVLLCRRLHRRGRALQPPRRRGVRRRADGGEVRRVRWRRRLEGERRDEERFE